jgi:hypothetical protein
VHGALGERAVRQSEGQAESHRETPQTTKQMMLKARAAGAQAVEVIIREMREAPRAGERLTAAGMLLDSRRR